MNRKINETLLELILGILTAGVLIQIIEVLVTMGYPELAGTRGSFVLGMWIGVATAVGLSVHMYRSIDRALNMHSGDAEKYMRKTYLIRTAAIFVAAGIVSYFKLGYVMAYFLGVLCLKFGAFLQPLMHNIRKKFRK